MFNEEFYPTPIGIVKRMIYPYIKTVFRGEKVIKKMTILEPSAGKGDLLDGITKRSVPAEWERDENGNKYELKPGQQTKFDDYDLKRCTVHCIEREPELQAILKEKGYKVVADDFLDYNSDVLYDLILMNPPFSNGDEHLLHAWNIMYEGDIVCLLNSETLNNPYSERRKLLKHIIEKHGTVEDLGPAFAKSERPTNVNVSLVRLTKKAEKDRFKMEFEEVNKERDYIIDETKIHDAPAIKDTIGNMLIQYERVKEEFITFMKMHEVLRHYGDPLIQRNYDGTKPDSDIVALALHAIKEGNSNKETFSLFCSMMKKEMWGVVFQNLKSISSFNLESIMTSQVRKNWQQFVSEKGEMDFTKENVWKVIEMLFMNRTNILERCIVEAFDLMTTYHKENRMYIEGWKTNDSWKVNRKFILPTGVRYGDYLTSYDLKKYGDRFGLSHHSRDSYSDIDKALAYIIGTSRYTSIGEALERKFQQIGHVKTGDKFDNTCESTFFKIKFWRKGTVHCEFKDVKLWEQFNLRACSQKQWLPPEEESAFRKSQQKEEPKEKQQLLLEI